jgi:hypothetical protein
MKLITTIVVAALVGVGLGYAATVAEFGVSPPMPNLGGPVAVSGRQPRLLVEQLAHDFGRMYQNSEDKHTFVLRNVGLADLRITPGKPSCRCTVSQVSRKVIPPGETAEVTLTWKTGYSRNKFAKTAPISTNDPTQPLIRLKIQGIVVPEFAFEPNRVFLPELSQHDRAERELKLLFFEQDNVQILGHQLSNSELEAHYQIEYRPIPLDELDDETATCGYVIAVTVLPGLPMGSLQQDVIFETSIPTNSPVRLQVLGSIQSDISIYGRNFNPKTNTLAIGTVKRGEKHLNKLAMYLIGEHRHNVELKVTETVPEDLKVTLGEPFDLPVNRLRIPLSIEIPADAKPTAHLGTEPENMGRVVIETSHPHNPEVRIYVRVAVAD